MDSDSDNWLCAFLFRSTKIDEMDKTTLIKTEYTENIVPNTQQIPPQLLVTHYAYAFYEIRKTDNYIKCLFAYVKCQHASGIDTLIDQIHANIA